mmetsp:Transcript_24225/g.36713  ORF Transcript_24225/g.36713 Transcript_24225/m.36713 type:complete len:213 (+) Transcript_24225:63-701(+)
MTMSLTTQRFSPTFPYRRKRCFPMQRQAHNNEEQPQTGLRQNLETKSAVSLLSPFQTRKFDDGFLTLLHENVLGCRFDVIVGETQSFRLPSEASDNLVTPSGTICVGDYPRLVSNGEVVAEKAGFGVSGFLEIFVTPSPSSEHALFITFSFASKPFFIDSLGFAASLVATTKVDRVSGSLRLSRLGRVICDFGVVRRHRRDTLSSLLRYCSG